MVRVKVRNQSTLLSKQDVGVIKGPFAAVPQRMKALRQWIVWRGPTKFPFSAITYQSASSTDPSTWATFKEAVAAWKNRDFDGIAFVFAETSKLIGIDLDACHNPETGEILPWAAEILSEFQGSYIEVSGSGYGFHVVIEGALSDSDVNCGRSYHPKGMKFGPKENAEIAVFRKGKYFDITGKPYGEPCPPRNAQMELDALFAKYWGDRPAKRRSTTAATASSVIDVGLLEQLLNVCRSTSDRSKADYRLCCIAHRMGWPKDDVWAAVQSESKFGERGPRYFDETWDNAGATYLQQFANAVRVEKTVYPVDLNSLIAQLWSFTDGWPRKVDSSLFIHHPQTGVGYLKTAPALFGWIQSLTKVIWSRSHDCCTKEEFFHEVLRNAPAYRAIQSVPHQPLIDGYYYSCQIPDPGDGVTFTRLVDRFCPATPLDRVLIAALFLTPMWGGPFGSRPVFVITADGRGRGKSVLADMVGQLYGGSIDFRKGEDAEVIAQRLLSSKGRDKRIILLDNLKSRNFSWADFESMVTATTISGKQLYMGEGTRPNDLTFIITVNDASFSTDMAQRSVLLQLQEPERTAGWLQDTRNFIDEHRDALIADIIGLLQHPDYELSQFSRWSEWEDQVLSCLPEADAAQALILDRQNAVDADVEVAKVLEECIERMLRQRGHSPDRQRVRIPSKTLAMWFQDATGEPESVIAVGKRIHQLIQERRLARLQIDKSNKKGRCYLWIGARLPVDVTTMDLRPFPGLGTGGTR